MRLTDEEIAERLKEADRRCPIAGRVRHRRSGRVYIIKSLALKETDLVPLAIYAPEDAFGVTFARPVDEIVERFVWVSTPGGVPPKGGKYA